MAAGTNRAVELAKCAADPAYFTDQYGIIDDAQGHGDGGGTMPFRLWPAQVRVLWQFIAGRLFIILKARQLGISWLCCSYALWLCVFQQGKVVLLFSQGENEAMELLRRIQVLYERLPDWMLETLPPLVKSNTGILEWANGSMCRSLPATKKAGRSFTASLVILDEAAFLQWAKDLYTALKPTIDGGGQLIILSTANGIGNLFHALWQKAEARLNKFVPIFLPWWSRPGRTAEWYEAQKGEYTDPAMVKQEYPATAAEAFQASGRVRFAQEWLEKAAKHVRTAIGLPAAKRQKDGDESDSWSVLRALKPEQFCLYKLPEADGDYLIGADVAEGLAHGDYSTAVVIDADTWEEVACLHGHWEPDEFARLLMALQEIYDARLAVERNNHGHAVLATLRREGARGVVKGPDKRPGIQTTSQSKPEMIDLIAEGLRDDLIRVRSQATIGEMQIYRIDDDGTTGAPESYHDDRVMSWGIALYVARGRRRVLDEDSVG